MFDLTGEMLFFKRQCLSSFFDKYRMKINEDYLDDIEMNVSDDSKSDIDAAASEDAAALDLTFDALVNIKNYKKPEEWYFQKLAAMLRMFYGFLDKCPYIEES